MEVLVEIYHWLLAQLDYVYKRRCYQEFSFDHRFMGIVGARGVGKTTFLLQFLKEHYGTSEKALYISADHMLFSKTTLLDIADQFYKECDGALLCIDEIHRYKNWNQELKNLYDAYPKLKVLFSGSSSIDLMKGKYDLSRRVLLKKLNGLSFREFLEVKHNIVLPVINLETLIAGNEDTNHIAAVPKLLGYFKEYLVSGYYPIFLEIPSLISYQETLINIIEKTIYEDISGFYSLKTNNIHAFRKILAFIATIKPGSFSINNLAKSIEKDHATTAEYLEMLRESNLLTYLLNDKKGHAFIRAAEKIFFQNTNLYYAIASSLGKEPELGTIRESFVLQSLQSAHYNVFYSEKGDMWCNGYIFEIGGRSKTNHQLKHVENSYRVLDNILVSQKNIIPVYLFGFLS